MTSNSHAAVTPSCCDSAWQMKARYARWDFDCAYYSYGPPRRWRRWARTGNRIPHTTVVAQPAQTQLFHFGDEVIWGRDM